MRVIAGTYKGRNLKSPPSMQVRPTSDRLRETLFNVINPRIQGARFLDLCAGSGAVGIEALSRGAEHATFVDRSRKSCSLIEANVKLCRIPEEQYEIYQMPADEFLRTETSPWDIIFFDPPYQDDYSKVLTLLGSYGGLVIVEHHHKTDLSQIRGLQRTRILKQGDSALSFYQG
jgi:16S rRNA (guanine966-N2)-methyltransferase